ncbi:MAG: protein kinase domain-containing protein, partial [Acidobacteriota bacterium]
PTLTVAETLFDSPLSVALVVCSTLALSTRHRLRRWLDRRFFRDAADRDQLLLQLVEEIKHHDTPDDMARLVGQRLEGALHPAGTRVHFLEASSEGAAAEVDPSLLQTLDQRATPQDIGFDLAVPIGGGGRRLHGLLLLGPKRSEEPYSREDRRLLQAIADQMAILCENNALRTDAAHHLKIQQHVLAHAEASGVNLLKECPACGRCFDRDQESCDVDGTPVVLSLPVDRTIDGRYRLERLLGRGGMASVYLASDRRLGREVAVKLLKAPGDTGARRRFEREARTSARLRHPHLVTVHDFGSVGPELGYLVRERLTGTTLRDELRTRGAVAPRVAAEWFDQILSAVAFAHAEGIVHRDLKPENVFIAREADGSRTVKVLDFGLAKLTASDATTATNLTDAGAVLGTLAYMSPEQIAGESTDERTDIFALGVLAIETVTGRHPFRRDDQFATVAAILNERAGIAGGASDIRALDAVIQRCCAKNAAERFSAVADMRAALLPALRGCSSLAIRT